VSISHKKLMNLQIRIINRKKETKLKIKMSECLCLIFFDANKITWLLKKNLLYFQEIVIYTKYQMVRF
jgi:hypothetical protein